MRYVVLATLAACGNHTAAPAAAPPHLEDAAATKEHAPVPAHATTGPAVLLGGARVTVALARTEPERERGLMYVNYLPPDQGMLFIFDADAPQTFWMKNTLIPLDMIFIRGDKTVAGVVASAKPLTLDPRGVNEPVRYVLEVNGGWAAAHGVGPGTKVRFVDIP